MKKFLLVSFLLICLFCVGCRIQFGSHIFYATYYETPRDAYIDLPYSNPVTHTYLDVIEQEVACIPVNDREVLWIAVLNEKNIVQTTMRVNDKNEYCASGHYRVYTFDPEMEGTEVYLPSKAFELLSGQYIYDACYTEAEYNTIQEQIDKDYERILFSLELQEEKYNMVYVYAVK